MLRFFAALYCITSEATFDALRGGAIEQGTDTKDENGHYDLCLTNLPNVPTARTMRDYGEIVDFEWSPSIREPQWAAVVEFEKGRREAYFFRELPSLVIAAESKQPDDVILEYEDLPDDDELPGDGERDLMAALDAVRAEED